MKKERKQTKIRHTHLKILRSSWFLFILLLYHAQTVHCSRSISDSTNFIKCSVLFCRNWWKNITILLFGFFLLLSFYVESSATGVYSIMHTFCIIYERHKCSMCMRSRSALSLQDSSDALQLQSKLRALNYRWHKSTSFDWKESSYRSKCFVVVTDGGLWVLRLR